jgi:hypothetical protein
MRHIPGLEWLPSGQAVLSGPLLDAHRVLDVLFARWAREAGAVEYRLPPFVPVRQLRRASALHAGAGLVAVPAEEDEHAEDEVLIPSAGVHFCSLLQDRALEAPQTLTAVATCFRREAYYRPLQRQSSFTVREVARFGTAEEVQELLDGLQGRAGELIAALDLPVEWRPGGAEAPWKTALVYGGELALGSLSAPGRLLGEAFRISRDGEPACWGGLALGLERWLYALLTRHGPDPRAWPAVVEAR